MSPEMKTRLRTRIKVQRRRRVQAWRERNMKACIKAGNHQHRLQKMLDIATGHGERHGVFAS